MQGLDLPPWIVPLAHTPVGTTRFGRRDVCQYTKLSGACIAGGEQDVLTDHAFKDFSTCSRWEGRMGDHEESMIRNSYAYRYFCPLHAPDLHSFLPPREQASASILTRVHAETWTHADIAITTAEGDIVVLSAGAVLQTAYTSYDARGRLVGQGLDVHAEAAQLVTSQDMAITVAGDLSDAELADVYHLLENLGVIVADFLAGDLDEAVTHALDLGALDTLANFDASFSMFRHVRVEQHYTAQGNLRHTPASTEQPVSSARISPKH